MASAPFPSAEAWLDALPTPAAVLDASGRVTRRNAAFRALKPEDVAPGRDDDWIRRPLGPDATLLMAVDPRLARRERMLATLSHEIRTPLNGVLGMAGLLAGTGLDATQAAYLAALRDSGEHLLGLVSEMLDYARLDAGRLELEHAPVDVERLLQGVAELLSPRAHAGGIEIAWALEDGPQPPVLADDGRLRQILFNLAGNAVKLTRSGGVLLTAGVRPANRGLGAADDRLTLTLAVRDTGPGLAADAQARVFDEFEQAAEGAQAGGAGLGLAIVRRLATAFGGRLTVASAAGEGALFAFAAEFAPAPWSKPERRLEGVRVGVQSRSPVVQASAAAHAGAEGAAALRLDGRADADVQVRLVDGGLAPAAAPPGPPTLVLLAPEERDRIVGLKAAGYAGYLIKPLRRASVAARVRAALDASPSQGDDERAASRGARGTRVLLAEDNPVNALLAQALLAREGCEVRRAASGEEAVDAVCASAFDLILMDVRMPGVGGLEAARRLRALGVLTPIVALTANAFEDDRRACREAGMDDFLTKPLDSATLSGVLARWSGRRAAA